MRIASQNSSDVPVQSTTRQSAQSVTENNKPILTEKINQSTTFDLQANEKNGSEDKVNEAITSLNELLEMNDKQAKFVKHEGLDKYFVRLIDSETEEVIKEIPPERLLNAFYEMQKLVGMIVDEKI